MEVTINDSFLMTCLKIIAAYYVIGIVLGVVLTIITVIVFAVLIFRDR